MISKEMRSLKGVTMVVGDNISTKDIKTTASSKMLQDYIPPFNATVVEKLLNEGSLLVGKGSIKEFGVGKAHNPWGTAELVAKEKARFGIASDTEGEVRQSAAHYGLYGLKPTYGLVSRYGLIACASSLDTLGILSKNIEDISRVLGVISGKDPKDSTSLEIGKKDYIEPMDIDIKKIKIGVAKNYLEGDILESLEKWKELGTTIELISMESLDYALESYEIISSGEFSSNMGRFDGIGYGYRTEKYKDIDELYKNSRSESLGEEVKKKILFGNFVLSSGQYEEYYEKSQRIRTMIKEEFDNIFKNYDFILTSVSPIFTVGANLAGIPALSLPLNKKKPGLGFQILSAALSEERLLGLGRIYDRYILKQGKRGGEI